MNLFYGGECVLLHLDTIRVYSGYYGRSSAPDQCGRDKEARSCNIKELHVETNPPFPSVRRQMI